MVWLAALALVMLGVRSCGEALRRGSERAERHQELERAIRSSDPDGVRRAIARGADPRWTDQKGYPRLFWVASRDDDAVARELVAGGASPDQLTRTRSTPMALALFYGRRKVVRVFLDAGSARTPPGCDRPYLVEAASGCDAAIVERLIRGGADLHELDGEGRSALIVAVSRGSAAVVRVLLQHGAHVNHRDHLRRSALMVAAEKGNEALVRLLIQHGADRRARDSLGRTAEMLARKAGHLPVVRMLRQSRSAGESEITSGVLDSP